MAETKTLRLEVGKKYLTRDGQVAEVTSYDLGGGTRWPFWGTVEGHKLSWQPDGTHFTHPNQPSDLVSEIPDEVPVYRYFRYHDDDRTNRLFVIWRNAPGDRIVEGWLPNKQGDEWTDTGLSLTDDLLSDPNIIECDAEGLILGRPELVDTACSFRTTEDLTPESRTRIAKLAARIVLADGPIFTVDELAGMTIGELVTILEDVTIYSI